MDNTLQTLQSKFERYVQMFDQLDSEACLQDARDQELTEDSAAFWNVALSSAVAAVNGY